MILYNNTLYTSLRSLVQFGIPRGALAICLLTFSRASLAQPMLTKTPYLARKVPQRKETAVKFMLKNVTVCIYIYMHIQYMKPIRFLGSQTSQPRASMGIDGAHWLLLVTIPSTAKPTRSFSIAMPQISARTMNLPWTKKSSNSKATESSCFIETLSMLVPSNT